MLLSVLFMHSSDIPFVCESYFGLLIVIDNVKIAQVKSSGCELSTRWGPSSLAGIYRSGCLVPPQSRNKWQNHTQRV